ncbi:hydroxysqualene dehydroxylase HpnE [Orrella sp. JC864]|uniref:hydroxysqualene dehydroxylase HpnE n=1 Tax=Orrella sp. JC864 TaxID=3120298 RepID=UPI0012BD71F7
MKVAVVGAGWAGLAAAVGLHDAGCAVTVFDAAHTPGGRARRIEHDGFPQGLDNGQHILLGAYDQTLALIERLHGHLDGMLRLPLRIESLDGRFRLRVPALPAPLHGAAALALARGLGAGSRLAALRMAARLRRPGWQCPPGYTVADLLARHGQTRRLRDRLWEPLCLAALNTPPSQACARLFVRVLQDSLAGQRQASDMLLPRTDLSALWPDAAIELVDWRPGHAVRHLSHDKSGVQVDGERYDALVLAVPPVSAGRLLAPLPAAPGSPRLQHTLSAFAYQPIVTVSFRLAEPWRLPHPIMMLEEDPRHGHIGQWVVDRGALAGAAHGELAVVASAASAALQQDREALGDAVLEQLRTQLARRRRATPLPPVAARAMVTEKRATFSAVPGLQRPRVQSPWRRIVLAGDWTDTGYPGVLEGAVRSGRQACAAVLKLRAA